jgi:hypothetical protein
MEPLPQAPKRRILTQTRPEKLSNSSRTPLHANRVFYLKPEQESVVRDPCRACHMRTVMRRMGIEVIYRKPNTSKPAHTTM